jgi:hypothetical protein
MNNPKPMLETEKQMTPFANEIDPKDALFKISLALEKAARRTRLDGPVVLKKAV